MEKIATIVSLGVIFLVLQFSSGALIGEWDRNGIQHAIGGNVSFPDPNTVMVSNFSYDGTGIRVFLYSYRPNQRVDDVSGTIIPIRNGGDRGAIQRRRYNREDIIGDLPEGMTACDIGTLTVWCEPFTATFSRITVPRTIFIEEGESDECQLVGGNVDLPLAPDVDFDNCEAFADDIQVSWTVDTENSEVDFQICGCRPTQPGTNNYMAFGLSGSSQFTFMVGADVTVAWVDFQTGAPNAVDYYLTGRDQCRSGEGACPDTEVTRNGQRCTNNVRSDSIQGGIREGNQQCVIFSRPFNTSDGECDMDFDPSNENQYIAWAAGPLGIEPGSGQPLAFRHTSQASSDSPPVHLGRDASTASCDSTPVTCVNCPDFEGTQRVILDDTTLTVQIGPSGSSRGYTGITKQPAWGIAFWIDGVLIPELVVARNKTYTFIVEGGTDPNLDVEYHPFYITSSISGGRLQNNASVNAEEVVYAGFNGETPTAVGRFCEMTESVGATNIRETCGGYNEYLDAVTAGGVNCNSGDPGVLVWTPNDTTPDTVFYQCASHLNLGWRIRVTDGAHPGHSLLSLLSLLLVSLGVVSWNS